MSDQQQSLYDFALNSAQNKSIQDLLSSNIDSMSQHELIACIALLLTQREVLLDKVNNIIHKQESLNSSLQQLHDILSDINNLSSKLKDYTQSAAQKIIENLENETST